VSDPQKGNGKSDVKVKSVGRECPIHVSLILIDMNGDSFKTFYLETFGCQMNVHDSEKVIGTLVSEGYRQVHTVEEAGLVLYNTCSIRDKAEQKVFNRLNDYKKYQKQGKKFGVLGCVAQQEGEKIFERSPWVSLVCGSASYRNLPQMLAELEAGPVEIPVGAEAESGYREIEGNSKGVGQECPTHNSNTSTNSNTSSNTNSKGNGKSFASLVRITGLDDRETDECFETEFTARTNPHRGYITIIEGCDKFCAYCVVPFTRGKERSRTSDSVLAEARQMADLGYTEIQLLGQNVNSYKDPAGKPGGKKTFAELLAAVGEIPGIRRVRFTTSHPRDFGRDIIDAIDAVPTLCDHVHLPVQSGSDRVLSAMQRLYTREQYLERIAWMKSAKREISITSDMIVGFPGETEEDFAETLSLLDEVGYDAVFAFKYSPRPNTPSLALEDAIPEEEKVRRLELLNQHQRQIQIARYKKYVGEILEVMVEGKNEARKQYMGRTSHNKTLNFVVPEASSLESGAYVKVKATQSFPNSLLGELVV
jgi:tRNA-2-methylthio-N6-dimethylallyladenosine synthase